MPFIAVKANHAWQLGDEHSSRKRAKLAMVFVILGIIAGISTYVLALTLYFTLNKDEPVSYHHSNTQAGWLFLITHIYLYTIVEWWKNRIRSKIYIHVYEEIRERVEFRGLPQSGQKKGHSNIINYTSESLCRTIILNFDLDLIHFIQDCYVGLFVSDSSLMWHVFHY